MLQSLILQILNAAPFTFKPVADLFRKVQESQREPKWNVASLQNILLTMLAEVAHPVNICIFLDALDENADDNVLLVTLIERLEAIKNPMVRMKICVASRQWTVFTTAFSSRHGLEIHKHTYKDVRKYVHDRLSASVQVRPSSIFLLQQSRTYGIPSLGTFSSSTVSV